MNNVERKKDAIAKISDALEPFESKSDFPSYEKYLLAHKKVDSVDVRNEHHMLKHQHFMLIGKMIGWWELNWDIFPDKDQEVSPIHLVVKKLDDLVAEGYNFPKLLSELDLFESANDAKRNGWNKPFSLGDHFFKKKTYILRIV